jgi:hypothetical protein
MDCLIQPARATNYFAVRHVNSIRCINVKWWLRKF